MKVLICYYVIVSSKADGRIASTLKQKPSYYLEIRDIYINPQKP